MSDPAIQVEHVTKAFRLRHAGTHTLKSTVLDLIRRGGTTRRFEALRDVSFSVREGETLGIIGANGAGKSTLLALVAGTMAPTSGRIATRGSISSLLELGAGFHPDLTGRENVFLYGALMGLSRRQMRARFDAIVAFAGIETFIDQPVKHYSSGMYVRLGFAVAVEVDPAILLIDEVLAVGDATFQQRCVRRMGEFKENGKTMLIISHDLPTIQSVSDRILLLDEGRIIEMGKPEAVVETYQSMTRKKNVRALERSWGTGEVKITSVDLSDGRGRQTETFPWGGSLEARIHYTCEREIAGPVFGFAVSDEKGRLIYGNNTQIERFEIPAIRGAGSISLRIDRLLMARGTYLLSFSVHSSDHRTNYHRLDHCFPIAIESETPFEGCCYMPCAWGLTEVS
jgi:ABC-type polysaccharide/polyol phosphate transport system ATPase subunit